MQSNNANASTKDERTMIIEGLNKIIAELIPSLPNRLRKLTGQHSVSATIEYRGNAITYRVDEQGEIIAMSSDQPTAVYCLGQSNPSFIDLLAHPEHDIARAFILFWHKRISLQLNENVRKLELEHEIFEKFDATFDPKKSYLGLE